MTSIPPEARTQFRDLNKDGNNTLNVKNDTISKDIAFEFFIPEDTDIDLETFYNYNADKFGGEVTKDIEELRNDIRKKYEGIKDKEKPQMGLSNQTNTQPQKAEDEDKFYHKPTENTYIELLGQKILYKDGKYQIVNRPDVEPNPNIFGITHIIKLEKSEKTTTTFKQAMENAQNNEEKRNAIDNMIEDLLSWHSSFDEDFIKCNYRPGKRGNFRFAGYDIYYTIGEDYKPIINKEALYQKANCAE